MSDEKKIIPTHFDDILTPEDWEEFTTPIKGILQQEAIFLLGLWTQLHELATEHNLKYKEEDLIQDFLDNFSERRKNEECMEIVMNEISRKFYPKAFFIDVHYTSPFEQWVTEEWWHGKEKNWNERITKFGRKMIVARIWEYMAAYLLESNTFSVFPLTKFSPHEGINLDMTVDSWSGYYSHFDNLNDLYSITDEIFNFDHYIKVWCRNCKALREFHNTDEFGAICKTCEQPWICDYCSLEENNLVIVDKYDVVCPECLNEYFFESPIITKSETADDFYTFHGKPISELDEEELTEYEESLRRQRDMLDFY